MSVKLTDTGIQFPSGYTQTAPIRKSSDVYVTRYTQSLGTYVSPDANYAYGTFSKMPLNHPYVFGLNSQSPESQIDTTNNRWVAPNSGFYYITISADMYSSYGPLYEWYFELRKNGVIYDEWGHWYPYNTYYFWGCPQSIFESYAGIIYMYAGDYLENYVWHTRYTSGYECIGDHYEFNAMYIRS